MALNPVAYTENVVRSFLRYRLTAYPLSDPRLHAQMRALLSLDETRRSPLLKGPCVSLSRTFREGAAVSDLVGEGLFHPHLVERIPAGTTHLYSHQEHAIRAIAEGRTTLVSTGTGSGKTECFLYPVVSRCLYVAFLEDEVGRGGGGCGAAPGEPLRMVGRSGAAGIGAPQGIERPAAAYRCEWRRTSSKGKRCEPRRSTCARSATSCGTIPRTLPPSFRRCSGRVGRSPAHRRHQHEEIRGQLQRERTRIVEHLLPARFAIAGNAQAFLMAVEIRLPERCG